MSRQIRLLYPFNDVEELEVEYRPGKWARVTANEFRSIVGNRRVGGKEYDGPVFYSGTNHRYSKKKDESFRIVRVDELNKKLRKKKEVQQEIRSYDRDAKYR